MNTMNISVELERPGEIARQLQQRADQLTKVFALRAGPEAPIRATIRDLRTLADAIAGADPGPKTLQPGDTVTVWPTCSRGTGESYDTEPGLQPWKATYLGTTVEGKLLVQDGDYPPTEVGPENLKPNYR